MNDETQPTIEMPAEFLVNHLMGRVNQLTAELEVARATIAWLVAARVPDTLEDPVPYPPPTEP